MNTEINMLQTIVAAFSDSLDFPVHAARVQYCQICLLSKIMLFRLLLLFTLHTIEFLKHLFFSTSGKHGILNILIVLTDIRIALVKLSLFSQKVIYSFLFNAFSYN